MNARERPGKSERHRTPIAQHFFDALRHEYERPKMPDGFVAWAAQCIFVEVSAAQLLQADAGLQGFAEGHYLRMPYERIALQFEHPDSGCSMIAFAREVGAEVQLILADCKKGRWAVDWIIADRMNPQDWGRRYADFARIEAASLYEVALMVFLQFLNALALGRIVLARAEDGWPATSREAMPEADPADEFHTLVVHQSEGRLQQGEPLGGTHARPREHERAGNYAHFKDGRRVWRRSCRVNAGVGGMISKDYRFT